MLKKKDWFRIHSFTGVITGLLLFVICWSGTFAVISHELDWLVTPEVRSENPLPEWHEPDWQAILSAVQREFPAATLAWIERPLYAHSAAQAVVNLPRQEYVRVYVDPITHEVLGKYSYVNVQRFFRSFHMNLFLPGRIGSYIVMAFSITLLISAVAALYFYSRWWKRFFRFSPGRQAFWSELHKSAGLWSLWFILVIAITGGWYLFELMRGHIGDGKITYTASGAYAVHQIPEPSSDPALPVLPLNELVARAQMLRPDLEIRMVNFNWGDSEQKATFYVDGQSDHLLVRNRANQVTLDSRTGEVLYNQNAAEYPLYWRWSDTADPLHFGDFGGLVSKLVWFFFGLVLSGIILTGTWLHARRLQREKNGRQRNYWPGTLPAVLASLVVFSASIPFGLQSIRDYYGLLVGDAKVLPELAPGVAAVIGLWIVATLGIITLWCYWLFRFGEQPAQKPVSPPSAAATRGMETAG